MIPEPRAAAARTSAAARAAAQTASRFADALRAAARRSASGPTRPRPGTTQTGAAGQGPRRRAGGVEPEPSATAVTARIAGDVVQSRGAQEASAAASVETLRAAVRALPAAVEAQRLAAGMQVALALGPALGVDLRSGATGIEVTLRPAAALAGAAAAELPGLVAALRARGIRVSRATVTGRTGGAATATARPDATRVDAALGLR